VSVNACECTLLGREEAEILGHPVWDFVSPEERDISRAAVLRKLAGAEPIARFERDYVRPDGGRLTLEIYDELLFDEPDHICGIRSFLIDVTKRKRMEQALQDSQRRYQHLVENASDIVYRTDINGRFIFFNPVAMSLLKYTAEEIVGRSYLDLVRPDYRQKMRQFYREQLISGTARTYTEFPALTRDGSDIWFGQNVQLVREGEKVVGFQAITRDITRRRILEEEQNQAREELERRVKDRTAELEIANDLLRKEIEDRHAVEQERRRLELQIQHAQRLESLGILAGGIAHDFNNLLTAIMGHASFALSLLPPSVTAARSMEEVLSAAESAAQLTHQMLAYSGRGKFIIEEIDLSDLVEQASHFVRSLISKKADLSVRLAPGLPRLQGDATQIRQVLINLLTNASESLENTAGSIHVTTGAVWVKKDEMVTYGSAVTLPEGQYVFIEVQDTGCGMDPETIERIFDPFFTTKFTGRGLGLAAVIGIVRGHKGTLSVESAPGRGSRFRVLFPSSGPSLASETPPLARDTDAGTSWNGHGVALVVDDEHAVREVAADCLRRAGMTVITGVDGPDGVRKFKEHQATIDVVVLDLTMPGMDGIDVLQEIRRMAGEVRVVLSSGYNLNDLGDRVASNLISGFLRKPYLPSDLIKTVRAAMDDPVD
jgi:PAS domain S-box-containing protein